MKITSAVHDPEFISGVLGTAWDRAWRIGDIRPNTIIQEKLNGWILNSGLEQTRSLDEQIKALLLKTGPLKHQIKRCLVGDSIEMSCVIYADSPPALNFPEAVIAEIGDLGASLDIDLYFSEQT
jgi:hypothetical protein